MPQRPRTFETCTSVLVCMTFNVKFTAIIFTCQSALSLSSQNYFQGIFQIPHSDKNIRQQTLNRDSTGFPTNPGQAIGSKHTHDYMFCQAAHQRNSIFKLATMKSNQSAGKELSVLLVVLFFVDPIRCFVASEMARCTAGDRAHRASASC